MKRWIDRCIDAQGRTQFVMQFYALSQFPVVDEDYIKLIQFYYL